MFGLFLFPYRSKKQITVRKINCFIYIGSFSIFITQIKTTAYCEWVVYLPKLIWINVMTKVISVVLFTVLVSACSYNPVQYEQQRAYDNALHSKQNG